MPVALIQKARRMALLSQWQQLRYSRFQARVSAEAVFRDHSPMDATSPQPSAR
jgi:hypothetical protein